MTRYTIKHALNFKAIAFLSSGDILTRCWCTEAQCNHWIDLMFNRYGTEIIATDIIPNT